MKIKEVENELKNYLYNKRYIEKKQEEIDRLELQIQKTTATYSDMPKGGSGGKEDLIANKIDLEKEVYIYLMELMKNKAIIEKTLKQLEPKHRNVLEFRYIENMSLMEIAVTEHYSYSQCKRIYNKALAEYADIRNMSHYGIE